MIAPFWEEGLTIVQLEAIAMILFSSLRDVSKEGKQSI